jgi:energy-coupling factor transport system substrate-specific component
MKKFSIKDIIFMAIITAAMLVVGFLTIPLAFATQVPGMPMVFSALPYAFFLTIVAYKIRKTGTIFIIALLNALVLLMMSLVMFSQSIIAGILCELVILICFAERYQSDRAIMIAAALFQVFVIPVSLLVSLVLANPTLDEYLASPWLLLPVTLGTLVLGIIGAILGLRVAKELKKAGVLK